MKGFLFCSLFFFCLFGFSSADDDKKLLYLTREELSQYTGENGKPVYLAIKGKIFDVSSAEGYYGKGGSYSGFAGRDATRAFLDLCFTEECLKVAHKLGNLSFCLSCLYSTRYQSCLFLTFP